MIEHEGMKWAITPTGRWVTIIDTHGGSMSIAIACDIEGFDLTLCEIDPDYFAAGKKRLEQHQSAPRLFAPEPAKVSEQMSIDIPE